MSDSKQIDEFLWNFDCRLIKTNRRRSITKPFVVTDYSDLDLNYMETQNVYVLEISELGLDRLVRWAKYMDRNFSSDPREFFQNWWTAQDTEYQLRKNNPAVAAAYAEYQTLLTLAAKQPEKLKPLITDSD